MHKNHYSEDVGEALARLFLLKLDPFMVGDPEKRETPADLLPRYSSWQPVMKFESPIVHYAIFPGPLYYLKLRSPGKEVPMAIQQCLPRQGHTLTTDKGGNYFRLHLNVLHVVDAVTCLSHKPFCPEILQQLYGKHEAFFNKLFIRFQAWSNDTIKLQIHDLLKSKFTTFDPELNELQSSLMSAHHSVSSISTSESFDGLELKFSDAYISTSSLRTEERTKYANSSVQSIM
ncbi:hypothetical protein HF086_012056 [Spodoptera exigua]|uniref:CFAP61 dimerisation domain-containing protein n=1 Tax=Spodoptera exigua TaxID=7107 RepID=A0A922SHT4_SPOEX|nr:hypothetical protein HF086_012056 [Spodoptera exigua]